MLCVHYTCAFTSISEEHQYKDYKTIAVHNVKTVCIFFFFFFLPLAPHQPRLDWQMWFAALGSYQHNPWFLNLVYRILQGEPDGQSEFVIFL